MLKPILLAMNVAVWTLPASTVQAQTAATTAVNPSSGLWWTPGENGHFMNVAIGPGNYVFITLTESDASGAPSYVVMQGTFEYGDASGNEGIARLASKFYAIPGAGCLECGPGSGRTVETGRNGILRFIDGTHAELLDSARVLRRYELFPLYTRAQDQTSERVLNQRFVLSADAGGEKSDQIVRLTPIEPDARCESADFANARNFKIEFVNDPLQLGNMAKVFANARVQIVPGFNPRITMKSLVTELQGFCSRPVALCALNPPPPTGRQLCRTIYNLHEQGLDFVGAAVPFAGAPILSVQDRPFGATQFVGGLSLRALPGN